jgi:hypothetical protein
MIRTEIENSVEFIRLQKAIKATMFGIAYHAYMRSSYDEDYNQEKRYSKVCGDVDTAFSAIENCFEDFGSITDTMCRDFAKSEILCAIEQCELMKEQDPKFNVHNFFVETITAESVFEDILDMNAEDFDIDAVDEVS